MFRAVKDSKDVQSLLDVLTSLVNPFGDDSTLLSLSSGAVADQQTTTDLLTAKEIGENRLDGNVKERLIDKSVDFFAAIKTAKLKTFAGTSKRKTAKPEYQVIKSDRSLFIQLLMVAKERDLDLKQILSYSLSPVPGCLSSSDLTSIAKTTKSSLLKHMETVVPDCQLHIKPAECAVVIDAMALIQSLPSQRLPGKFGAFAELVLERSFQIAKQFNGTRVDLVGDRYDVNSIKDVERRRRNQSAQQFKIDRPDQALPVQWKEFLRSGANKAVLQSFLSRQLPLQQPKEMMTMVLAMEYEVRKCTFEPGAATITEDLPYLKSDHEEADTRLLLHANDCASSSNTVVIWSPDTDVAVIGIGSADKISANVLFATGTGKNQRLLDLTKISHNIGQLAPVLPQLHTFTGCDTTSSFYGKGKKAAFTLAKANDDHITTLQLLGKEFALPSLPPGIEKLTCALYGSSSSNINDARFDAFKNGTTEKALPPNADCLLLHTKRANYQSKIWLSALQPMIAAESPVGNGWEEEGGELKIKWMDGPSAPKSVMQTTKCQCKANPCTGNRCSCLKAGMKCTALCGCRDCNNRSVAMDSEEESDDDDEF